MTRVKDIAEYFERLAPACYQEDYDNVGLLVGDGNSRAEKVLIALDITSGTVEEARAMGAQLILSHHPVIFSPMKRVTAGSVPYELIRAGISALCLHTNLDSALGGVSDVLAELLGLTDARPLEAAGPGWVRLVTFVPPEDAERVRAAMAKAGAGRCGGYEDCFFETAGAGHFTPLSGANPYIGVPGEHSRVPETRLECVCEAQAAEAVLEALRAAHPYEQPAVDVTGITGVEPEAGIGRYGDLPSPIGVDELLDRVRAALNAPALRYSEGGRPIRRLAVVGGSGGDQVKAAAAKGCDALVTGDVKYHTFQQAEAMGLTLIDAGHFETELPVCGRLLEWLQTGFPQVEAAVSKQRNVVRYRM